jgi:hypothetical protein
MVWDHISAILAQDKTTLNNTDPRMIQDATVHPPRLHYCNNDVGGVGRRTPVDCQCSEREWDRRVPTVGQQWYLGTH